MTDHIEPFHQPHMDYRYGIICIRELLQAMHDICKDYEFYFNNKEELHQFENYLYLMEDLFQKRMNEIYERFSYKPSAGYSGQFEDQEDPQE